MPMMTEDKVAGAGEALFAAERDRTQTRLMTVTIVSERSGPLQAVT